MPYATQNDLEPSLLTIDELIQLTDDSNSGLVNPATVNAKLADASGQVEMYCRQRYSLPLQPTAEVVALTAKIAAYLLWSRRRRAVSDEMRQMYADAMQALRDIASGKASLDQPIQQPDQTASGATLVTQVTQVFGVDVNGDDNLAGFA